MMFFQTNIHALLIISTSIIPDLRHYKSKNDDFNKSFCLFGGIYPEIAYTKLQVIPNIISIIFSRSKDTLIAPILTLLFLHC